MVNEELGNSNTTSLSLKTVGELKNEAREKCILLIRGPVSAVNQVVHALQVSS